MSLCESTVKQLVNPITLLGVVGVSGHDLLPRRHNAVMEKGEPMDAGAFNNVYLVVRTLESILLRTGQPIRCPHMN